MIVTFGLGIDSTPGASFGVPVTFGLGVNPVPSATTSSSGQDGGRLRRAMRAAFSYKREEWQPKTPKAVVRAVERVVDEHPVASMPTLVDALKAELAKVHVPWREPYRDVLERVTEPVVDDGDPELEMFVLQQLIH